MKKYSDGRHYKVIAYCVSRFHRGEHREYIQSFCKWCERYDYKVVIFSTLTDLYYDDQNDRGEKQIYSLLEISAFDAVVIMSETFKKIRVDEEIADRAIKAGVPVISVDRQIPGCINIDFTYKETFEKIVRHIVEDHGCRKVNYIGGDYYSKFSKERFECYKKVLADNGIPFEEERTGYGNFVEGPALEVLDKFLKTGELPDAIVCANDAMAMGVCTRLREVGIRVPEDVKVTGFDGIEFEKYHNPRLTTAVYNWELTSSVICRTIESLLAGNPVEELILVPYTFQIGHSCGCNENYVMNATKRMIEIHELGGSMAEYYQEMTNMDAECNNCDEFEDILKVMSSFAGRIGYKEYWICLNKFCWDKISNKIPEDMDEILSQIRSGMGEVYSEQIVVASHSYFGKSENENAVLIDREELLPELDELFEREPQVMMLLLHLQGVTIGYFAVTLDIKTARLDLLNVFMMNVKRNIENYWSKIMKEHLFSRDDLTGLYNKIGFQKQKRKLFAGDKSCDHFALISMDVDNLKKINDQYGHAEGDFVLQQVGKILESIVRKDEICARVGGDEFMIMTTDESGRTRADEIIATIHEKLLSYNMLSGKTYEVWVSSGCYSGENVEQFDFEIFLSQADKEMYLDKERNKGRVR